SSGRAQRLNAGGQREQVLGRASLKDVHGRELFCSRAGQFGHPDVRRSPVARVVDWSSAPAQVMRWVPARQGQTGGQPYGLAGGWTCETVTARSVGIGGVFGSRCAGVTKPSTRSQLLSAKWKAARSGWPPRSRR